VLDQIIEPRQGVFRVERPWVAADEYSTGVGVFLATWRGRMGLSAGFNAAFHAEEEVRRFLEDVRGCGGCGAWD
jgi:hypothetical protein